jgi:hypothetical protein
MTKTLERIPVQPAEPQRPPRRKPFDLSATQIAGTGLAATTATIAASFLGVAGTVIGAALASVLTAIGSAVYTQSLRRTHERVRDAVPGARRKSRATASEPRVEATQDTAPVFPAAPPVPMDARIWRRIALASIVVFVAVLAAVTAVELIAGRPLSDVVRGDSGQGTSLFGDQQHRSSTPAPQPPKETVTRTVTPAVHVVTPTVTQTAPAVTHTSTPTVTASAKPSATASRPSGSPVGPTPRSSSTPSSTGD